ncbi:MAG TPA: carboxypeptidase-like regulatory domain-containing protein [Verrucomicrobiae bacterium]|jgi:hypothetical protein
MRTRFLLLCGIVLAFCVWLLLYQTGKQQKVLVNENNQAASNQPNQLQQPQQSNVTTEYFPNSNSNGISAVSQAVPNTNHTATEEQRRQFIANWQAPIDFYGQVVDENTNPVEGASVQFEWDESPTVDVPKTASRKSDVTGLFSLEGERGRVLNVLISKEGYYSSRKDKTSYMYALTDNKFSPSALNPVIFHLLKKGTGENLIAVKQNYRVPRDGTPLGIDLTTGKAITGGTGNLVVQCWTNDQGKRSGQKYDWHCLITIPGGGLVLSDEEFPFSAPENGYISTNEIVMPADFPHWKNDVDLKFYYQLPNGNYGRMTFSMIAGGQHFCMIDSVLNPTDSRNLEPVQ